MIKTYHIHIKGIVQGVGFRPFVYNWCLKKKFNGWINNTQDGVHIQINLSFENPTNILQELINDAPTKAQITDSKIQEVPFVFYDSFNIIKSDEIGSPNAFLTPDFAICVDCENELFNLDNSRSAYPFITCTNCGPRYSIIKKLPYDREVTTMSSFEMCFNCNEEYNNPMDRRYFSQTNSCPECSIKLSLYENDNLISNFTDLDYIVEQWDKGKIIAIKGIGGYLLTCDATNEETIQRLRILKNRPCKPFALMYHDFYVLTEDVEMGIGEKLELEDMSSPIVLLNIKKDRFTNIAFDSIAPNLNSLGVMLPYTPLYKLLLAKFKKPIVATSGNISNSTIVYNDEKAISALTKISDLILMNNREIVIPQDDSVVRYSPIKNYKTILRRSRGLAPSYINTNLLLPETTILSMGAMLKSTFTLLNYKNIYISQYLGSTNNLEAEENYKNTLSHFNTVFKPNIEVILLDKHPAYFNSIYGKELALISNVKTVEIQHHKAHFFAVMAENNLLNSDEDILGVIWDGTGLGDDGNIWGGEFFNYKKGKVTRIHHIDEYPFILGDKMPKEPRISALVISQDMENIALIKRKFSAIEWKIYQNLLKSTSLKSTSIGRLFDAVASIVLDINVQSYEGEAAILLENAAYRYFRTNNFTKYYSYLEDDEIPSKFTQFLLKRIIIDIDKGFEKDFIAAKFHISLAHYIRNIAKKEQKKHVVFSGGVFQNQWLIELVIAFMDEDFELYFHDKLSPNDENISFGQLMYYLYYKN